MRVRYKNSFSLRWATFAGGERMPFLVRTETNVPIESATFWIVAHRRPLGLQPNTLANELRSLMYLHLWADARGVDVVERLKEGTFLALSEIIDLVDMCGRRIGEIAQIIADRSSRLPRRDRRRQFVGPPVGSSEVRNRISAIYSFIEFLSADFLSQLAPLPRLWDRYSAARNLCLDLIQARMKRFARLSREDLGAREGLGAAAVQRLREVIEPDSPDNPFKPSLRLRNYLIVRLLLDLGLRRGELLTIRVSDCSVGSEGSITVHRRPDDPDDPRRYKPATKTVARKLPLSGRLSEVLHEWVVRCRAQIPGARRHPFLIVSSPRGEPMSLSNVNKIFEVLRNDDLELREPLSPHVMRHSWNDAFSDLMDRKGIPPDQEEKWRARLMGWRSVNSAKPYLRRTVRRRSDDALLEMQDKLRISVREAHDAD